ncbi:hypothetical protein HHI36_013088 [Cryptolaemus montrouzieri]|uniref:trypsin n=1 Tax=Cryptolaemus montrouzieri TaxID=559131 RepID=A0ABD2NGF2_9CUCU
MKLLTKHNSFIFFIFLMIAFFPNDTSYSKNILEFTRRSKRRTGFQHMMDFKIVGGSETSIKDFPFMVSVQRLSHHICGGTIVTKIFVLTAAHCVTTGTETSEWYITDPLDLNVVAGQSVLDLGECQFRDVRRVFVNEQYNDSTLKNDVALIEIFDTFEWTEYTQVAELFSRVHIPFESYDFCITLGWGSTEAGEMIPSTYFPERNILQQVDLQPSFKMTCERFFSPAPEMFDDSKLCSILTGGKDACSGDSGGPIVCNGIQYGIVSSGLGCAQPNMAAVFVNVSAVHDWIYGVLNNTEQLVRMRLVEKINMERNMHGGTAKSKPTASSGVKPILKSFGNSVIVLVLCNVVILNKLHPI